MFYKLVKNGSFKMILLQINLQNYTNKLTPILEGRPLIRLVCNTVELPQ
jgi:hypothetical protein